MDHPGLPPHLHLARLDGSVILLDIIADRYSRLDEDLAAIVERALEGPTGSDDRSLGALAKAGLLGRGPDHRPLACAARSMLTASAAETTGIELPLHRWRVLGALLRARLNLRAFGLRRSLPAPGFDAADQRVEGRDAAVRMARGFEAARADLPISRQCLPDSLALLSVLRAASLPGTLVIGVRDPPFAAHAWVETGDMVLSDPLAAVREFTPILRR